MVTGIVAVAAGAVAAVRAALGRLSGEPGVASRQRGSFDSWPVVPPAPSHSGGDGSRAAAEPGAH